MPLSPMLAQANLNFGMSDELLVNWTHFLSNISRGLIQFNLGSLPGSATITGATLTLVRPSMTATARHTACIVIPMPGMRPL